MDAGEGHSQVEIEGSPYLGRFAIQELHVQMRLQGCRYVDQQRCAKRNFLFARQLRLDVGLGAGFRGHGRQDRRNPAFRLFRLPLLRSPEQQQPGAGGCRGQGKEGEHGETGHQAERHHECACDQQGPGLRAELLADVAGEILGLVRADPGDDDARRHGDQEGGDLCDQPVPDRQDRVDLHGLVEAQVPLRHADDQAADQVDGDDDQAGDGVALDEFHGAVHGAVELAFLLDDLPPPPRLGHVDHAGAHVPVDAHLFAGHGIERETGAHLGHPLGALGDHQELDDGDDQEDHHADHEVAGNDEVPERVDDGARVGLQQHESGRGNGERQPEQGGQQQNRGEREEIARGSDIDREHQEHDGNSHAHADEDIHQLGGQRQDHHENDGDQKRRQQHVLALCNAVEDVLGVFWNVHPLWP